MTWYLTGIKQTFSGDNVASCLQACRHLPGSLRSPFTSTSTRHFSDLAISTSLNIFQFPIKKISSSHSETTPNLLNSYQHVSFYRSFLCFLWFWLISFWIIIHIKLSRFKCIIHWVLPKVYSHVISSTFKIQNISITQKHSLLLCCRQSPPPHNHHLLLSL